MLKINIKTTPLEDTAKTEFARCQVFVDVCQK